jgi:hypothetical protein
MVNPLRGITSKAEVSRALGGAAGNVADVAEAQDGAGGTTTIIVISAGSAPSLA